MKGTKGAFVRAAVNNNWRSGAATVVGVTQSKNRPSGRGTIKYCLFLASLFKAQGQMPSLIEKQPNPSPWASQPTPPTNILQLQHCRVSGPTRGSSPAGANKFGCETQRQYQFRAADVDDDDDDDDYTDYCWMSAAVSLGKVCNQIVVVLIVVIVF